MFPVANHISFKGVPYVEKVAREDLHEDNQVVKHNLLSSLILISLESVSKNHHTDDVQELHFLMYRKD